VQEAPGGLKAAGLAAFSDVLRGRCHFFARQFTFAK